jgi:hypothetical protein
MKLVMLQCKKVLAVQQRDHYCLSCGDASARCILDVSSLNLAVPQGAAFFLPLFVVRGQP